MIGNFDELSEFRIFLKKVYNGDLNYSLLDVYGYGCKLHEDDPEIIHKL